MSSWPHLSEEEAIRMLTFRPQSMRRFLRVLGEKTPMVHYTSADAAMSIIVNRKIWLRNAQAMNDASEVHYGMDLLAEYFSSKNPARVAFWRAVDKYTNGRAAALQDLYDNWRDDLSGSTFILCVSEHDIEREHELGRLSMWRAYQKGPGVALVVDSGYLGREARGLAAYSYPIEYPNKQRAFELFAELERNVLSAHDVLSKMSADDIYNETLSRVADAGADN